MLVFAGTAFAVMVITVSFSIYLFVIFASKDWSLGKVVLSGVGKVE